MPPVSRLLRMRKAADDAPFAVDRFSSDRLDPFLSSPGAVHRGHRDDTSRDSATLPANLRDSIFYEILVFNMPRLPVIIFINAYPRMNIKIISATIYGRMKL